MFLEMVCKWLGIETVIRSSDIYPDHPDRVQRLVAICQAAGASRYVSGPAAKTYLDPAPFKAAGIDLCFFEYGEISAPRFSVIDGVLNS